MKTTKVPAIDERTKQILRECAWLYRYASWDEALKHLRAHHISTSLAARLAIHEVNHMRLSPMMPAGFCRTRWSINEAEAA